MNRGAFEHIKGGAPFGAGHGSAAQTATGDLTGIGDEAYVAGGSMLMVRKGNTVARFMYISCPCNTDNIKPLAQKLAMPEYRLRKLIHEELGYRNFNALLHQYRIAEASRDLADPAKNSLPILTIALTVGYNSINPFNRAFRDAKGMTPSAFRAQARADNPVLPTQQSLTES